MERCMVKTSMLAAKDIIYRNGNSIYVNSMISPNLSKKQIKNYISNINSILQSSNEIPFGGITTVEINKKKKRIMHNQISEGATEFISRKVMEMVGDTVKYPERYACQVEFISHIFKSRGLEESIKQYLTEPYKIILALEKEKVKGKDKLHYISEYINNQGIIGQLKKKILPVRMNDNGNIEPNIIDKIKAILSHKKKLPISSSEPKRSSTKNQFIESLRVKTPNVQKKRFECETQTKIPSKQEEHDR